MKLITLLSAMTLAALPAFAKDDLVAAAVSDPTRLEDQIARDADRKPAEILRLAGVKPGDKVAEIAPGGGYYTALLSRIVGDDGKIYAVAGARAFPAFPAAKTVFPAYLEKDPRANVVYSAQELDGLSLPEPVDEALMILYYHDTIWSGEDRAKMNKAIFDALKPGGVYLVIDHDALDGAGDGVTKALHRMEKKIVVPEVTAAGFKLEKESDLLRHPEDPRNDSVFDEGRRGKTDRFIYLFRKPA
jgi:predicted methyltransferase